MKISSYVKSSLKTYQISNLFRGIWTKNPKIILEHFIDCKIVKESSSQWNMPHILFEAFWK